MKKQIVISALLMLLSAPLFAGHVSETTAQRIAENFLKAKTHSKVEVALLEFEEKSDFPNFYVFGNEHCFVIVSADDCVHPILGYSTENGFGTRQMPENVKAWMQSYQDGIATAVAHHYSATEEIAAQWSDLIEGKDLDVKNRNAVEPLIQTKWGQGSPYNILCPENSLTGCVATAMAQVLKYWNYPAHGMGSHRYTSTYGVLYACFGNTEYDWENMFDEFSIWGEYTEEELMAVATLMYHCGVSVNMDYSPFMSQAYSSLNAFRQFFNYDPEYVEKENYSDDEWCELLINELENLRPVIYTGYGTTGHEFVCDGYDGTGLFHFNWGWDGDDDGYYQIGALNPYGSYNNMNHALIGIKPSESSASTPTDLSYSIDNRDVLLSWSAVQNACSYNIYFNNDLVYNTTETFFLNENTPSGRNEFYVRSVDGQGRLSLGTECLIVDVDCGILPAYYYFEGDFLSECIVVEEGNVHTSNEYYYGDSGNSLKFDRISLQGTTCTTSIITIPVLDCSSFNNGVELDFQWFRINDGFPNPSNLTVQYSIDNNSWRDLGIVYCQGDNEWTEETFYIPEMANAALASIRLVYSNNAFYSGYLDNLEIKEAPPCFPPSNVALTSLSDVSAGIAWSAGVASTGFTVAYGPSGVPIDEMTFLSTSTNSCVIESLNPLTAYDLVVKANCAESGETDWSELFSFMTECSAALPLSYSFDDGDMPECIKLDGDFYVNGSLQYGNPNGGSINSPDRPARVILQPIDLSDVNNGLEVNFKWYCNTNYLFVSEDRIGYVVVQYSLDGENWMDVDSPTYRFYRERVGVVGNESWMDQRINVPKIGNETKAYLSFLVTEPMYYSGIALDEIEVKAVSYYSPTHVEIGNVTNVSAVVSWSQDGMPINWLVAYGLSGEPVDEMEMIQANDTSLMIEGLEPGTQYDVYVKGIYAEGEESGWSLLNTFKTTSFVDFSNYITFDDGQLPEGMENQGPFQVTVTDELYYGDHGSCLRFGCEDWRELGNRIVFPVSAQNASAGIRVEFMWYHYRTIYDNWHMNIDFVQVQYSLDGYNWYNVGEEIDRWSDDENTFWTKETITIPELANQPFAFVGIVFQGWYGYYGIIDNLIIKEMNSIEEITQTDNLAEGWKWYAPLVKTNIESIQSALGDTLQLIQVEDGTPRGNVAPGQMFRIQTAAPCTLSLTGLSYTPTTILIHQGENWFGFVGTTKTVAEAFTSFTPAEGDKVISQNEGFAVYENGGWSGTLENLYPGKGYVYISNAQTSKTLVIGQ
jgi:hypothetical protein